MTKAQIGDKYGTYTIIGHGAPVASNFLMQGKPVKRMLQTLVARCDHCGYLKTISRNGANGLYYADCPECGTKGLPFPNSKRNTKAGWNEVDERYYEPNGEPKRGDCKYINEDCIVSTSLHRCCHMCRLKPKCKKVCKNTREKCGCGGK